MAGNFQKRGDGKYFLTYHIGYDSDGKRIRKTRTVQAKNDTEAKKKLAAFVTEVEKGEYVAPSHSKFGDYVDVWKQQSRKKMSPKTIEMYGHYLNARILPAFSHFKLEDITHVMISSYMDDLEDEKLATSTIQKHYNIMNGIFNMAVKHDLIKKNPMDKVDKPTVTYEPGQVYTSDELKQLYELLDKEENRQQVLIIKTALNTGMRKGEILALKKSDLDFSKNIIRIKHSLSYTKNEGHVLKEPKTKGSVRNIAVPDKLMKELKRHVFAKFDHKDKAGELWKGGQDLYVFSADLGTPLYPGVPNKWWNRFLKRTNDRLKKEDKQPFKKIRFHDLRHTFATGLIDKGGNVNKISKYLGHASITTTMDIYGHYIDEDREIADMIEKDYI